MILLRPLILLSILCCLCVLYAEEEEKDNPQELPPCQPELLKWSECRQEVMKTADKLINQMDHTRSFIGWRAFVIYSLILIAFLHPIYKAYQYIKAGRIDNLAIDVISFFGLLVLWVFLFFAINRFCYWDNTLPEKLIQLVNRDSHLRMDAVKAGCHKFHESILEYTCGSTGMASVSGRIQNEARNERDWVAYNTDQPGYADRLRDRAEQLRIANNCFAKETKEVDVWKNRPIEKEEEDEEEEEEEITNTVVEVPIGDPNRVATM